VGVGLRQVTTPPWKRVERQAQVIRLIFSYFFDSKRTSFLVKIVKYVLVFDYRCKFV